MTRPLRPSGKSSLVRAGLVPTMRRQGWSIHVVTPTAHPLKALASSLTRDSESVTAAATLMDDMARDGRSLDLYAHKVLAGADEQGLLLVVDQFEELFTLCKDEAARSAFIENLLAAVYPESPMNVVLTLRADFYHHCAQYEGLTEVLEAHQRYIGPMSREELRQVIELPAQGSGLRFEEGLVDLLLRDVGDEPGAQPLLSHALLETWRRREGDVLTLAGYTAAGGVHGAIARTADSVYEGLSAEQQTIARNIFMRLTEPGEGTQDTRRRSGLDELIPAGDGAVTAVGVLKTLADARLVTAHEDAAEVAHEALIREWPILRRWLDEDREGLRLHRQLTEAAQAWEAGKRDDSYLYRGARLEAAGEWAGTNVTPLMGLEQTFLAASQAHYQNELAQAEARAEREANAARNLRVALGLAAALVIVALLLFGLATSAKERPSGSAALRWLNLSPLCRPLYCSNRAMTQNWQPC